MYRLLISWTLTVAWSAAFMHDPHTTNQTDGSIDAWDCPLTCNCSGYDVICSDTTFPDNLPHETRTFHMINSAIPDIYVDALKDLHTLERIQISNTTIGTIRACSFAELENMTSIIFDYVTIKTIEGNAFSNMKNIAEISFLNSNIDFVKSYAFHNLEDIGAINMHEVNIVTIDRYAFLKIDRLYRITLSKMTIDTIVVDAVSKVTEVSVFFLMNSTISEWQCGSVKSILESGAKAHVTGNTFTCNCKLTWLFTMSENLTITGSGNENVCEDSRKLSDLSQDEICHDEKLRSSGCPRLLPSTPHTCARKFDEPFDPDEKVQYPSGYFTRSPAHNSAAMYQPYALVMLMCYLLAS